MYTCNEVAGVKTLNGSLVYLRTRKNLKHCEPGGD